MKFNPLESLNIIEAALISPYVFLNRQQTIDTASAFQSLKEEIEIQEIQKTAAQEIKTK